MSNAILVGLVLALMLNLAVWGPISANVVGKHGRTAGEGYAWGAFIGWIGLLVVLHEPTDGAASKVYDPSSMRYVDSGPLPEQAAMGLPAPRAPRPSKTSTKTNASAPDAADQLRQLAQHHDEGLAHGQRGC